VTTPPAKSGRRKVVITSWREGVSKSWKVQGRERALATQLWIEGEIECVTPLPAR
jgi:hypothetical protein